LPHICPLTAKISGGGKESKTILEGKQTIISATYRHLRPDTAITHLLLEADFAKARKHLVKPAADKAKVS
jgi:hypothetical protein